MGKEKTKIIIDCDCGVDDAEAIILALSRQDVEILAITCVQGNTKLDNVCPNVLRILKVTERTEIPVFRGCSKPLINEATAGAPRFHGPDGFGGIAHTVGCDELLVQAEHASVAICRLAKLHEGAIELIALGPLTNLAVASRLDPELWRRFSRVFLMGGNHMGHGNCDLSVTTEFNFGYDPEAAAAVIADCTSPLTIFPWETCYSNPVPMDFYEQWLNGEDEMRKFYRRLTELSRIARFEKQKNGYFACDLFAMAAFLDSTVAKTVEKVPCAVETSGRLTRGQLVIDRRQYQPDNQRPINVVVGVDQERLQNVLMGMFPR